MDAESFTDLALRVLSGEATADERRALETELSAVPVRREEFEQLKLTHRLLRTTVPMMEATRASAPELPAHRVNELRTAVRQHFGPAVNREKKAAPFSGWIPAFRWIFAGSGIAALGFAVVLLCFANRTVEVGLYTVDLVRNGDKPITTADVPSARLVQFDYDAPFDQWQNQPLAWNEHAKIWVDNEHDLLYIVRRVRQGQIVTETQPLAPTNEGQREQIKQVVETLKN
jgi:hypothetical protein